MSLAFLAVLGQLIDAKWFYRDSASSQNTALGLVLFFLAVPVFTFLLTPLLSLLSRRDEFEADRYAAAEHASAEQI
jgi:STE24 endopeptidase